MAKPIPARKPPPAQIRIMWEVIFKWRASTTKPFVWQKLGFKAGPAFVDGYREAAKIRRLIVTVGAYENSDVSIAALSKAGVLDRHNAEKGIVVRAEAAAVKKALAEARELQRQKPGKLISRTRG